MINEKGEMKENDFVGNPAKSSGEIGLKVSDSTEKSQLSADFRETLLKSGLDISAIEKTESANTAKYKDDKSPAIYAVNFAIDENKSAENKSVGKRTKLSKSSEDYSPERRWRWQHLMAIAGILTIIILQSIFQFSFIQSDNRYVAEDVKIERESGKIIETEAPKIEVSGQTKESESEVMTKRKTPDVEISPRIEKVSPKAKPESQAIPTQAAFRKKKQGESSGARLRRAEKLLTGF